MDERLSSAGSRPAEVLVSVAGLGLASGLILQQVSSPWHATAAWTFATGVVLAALALQIVRSLRAGDFGLDVVAALSMSAALLLGEQLAANVVALMYAGGQMLEDFARRRARREMTALLGRVSRTAMRYGDAGVEEVPIAVIMPADRLLIREGEVLPVDGRIAGAVAVLDLSALTGEPLPQRLAQGDEALSGSTCAGPAFDLVASRPAAESAYANVLRLVKAAQDSKASMARMADRYAAGFLLLTIVIAAAGWLASHDMVRIVAVLVVATPCPLILAVPVALIAGMSRTSRIGVLVKGSDVFEKLAGVRAIVVDKTGTLTQGRAEVTAIITDGSVSEDDILRHAASLDQASGHVAATSLIRAAHLRALSLATPREVDETPGSGIVGVVDGRRVVVGGLGFVRSRSADGLSWVPPVSVRPDAMTVAVGLDGRLAGVIQLEDRLRPDAADMLAQLRRAGLRRVVLASGDRSEVALKVGQSVGADIAFGDLTPEAKVQIVQDERRWGPVMMVGDGVNDAPALAAADVGVAMGARGTASSSEVAGVVLLVDELKALAEAVAVARRSTAIAMQSAIAGLALSIGAMLVAALGYLPPVQGALLQEAIDVAVILNALRALR
jgi:heavy metal translocating P-type ATPase